MTTENINQLNDLEKKLDEFANAENFPTNVNKDFDEVNETLNEYAMLHKKLKTNETFCENYNQIMKYLGGIISRKK